MSDAPRYFFNRQGARSGPHTLAEIEGFIASREITVLSWVFREGDEKWQAATAFPELAGALAAVPASPPPAAKPPEKAAPPAKTPAARPSSLTRVPYTPGVKPTAPGPYVKFDQAPADVAALLDAAIPKPPPPYVRHPRRTPLLVALAALAAAAVAADLAAGFDLWMFTRVLAPAAAVGFLLVMAATRTGAGGLGLRIHQGSAASLMGTIGFALVFTCVGGIVALVADLSLAGFLALAGAIVFLVLAVSLREKPPAGLTAAERAQVDRLAACRDIVAAIADDVAPGKTITGWADVTGARQPGKLLARGKSGSGATVELFRDEWLNLSAPLRDGTRLRLAAVDREKYKHPVARRRRTKPGSSQVLSTLEVRARINPRAYRTLAPEAQTGTVHALQLTGITATPEGVSAAFTRSSGIHLAEVMHAVAYVYGHLERLPAPAAGGAS
jgi:hypothetical protein